MAILISFSSSGRFGSVNSRMLSLASSGKYGSVLARLHTIARTLAKPYRRSNEWMLYIAIGSSDSAAASGVTLPDELYRKIGKVFVRRNTYFVTATFGQDEPTGDDLSIKAVALFDKAVAGQLGEHWVLDTPIVKDNVDEVVVECAITILHGTVP